MYLIMKARSEPYLRSQEVADVLGITKRTLMNWLRTQKIPEPERNQANRYRRWTDRKSTRLNSSHRCISYAVFCLKKTHDKPGILAHMNILARGDSPSALSSAW